MTVTVVATTRNRKMEKTVMKLTGPGNGALYTNCKGKMAFSFIIYTTKGIYTHYKM
jgi:hypothetical protein